MLFAALLAILVVGKNLKAENEARKERNRHIFIK